MLKIAIITKTATNYAYITGTVEVGGEPVSVRVAIRKSPEKNKFWVHYVDTNKMSTSAFVQAESKANPEGYRSTDVDSQNIAQTQTAVNTLDENSLVDQLVVPKEGQQAEKSDFAIENGRKAEYNKDNQYVVFAPYYDTEANSGNEELLRNTAEKRTMETANEVANYLGVKIDSVTKTIGGFTHSDGHNVNEVSYALKIDDPSLIKSSRFGAFMAENGYEQQAATIAFNFVKDVSLANAYEVEISYKNIDVFDMVEILNSLGINDYTICKDEHFVQLLDFENVKKGTEAVKQAERLANALGGNYGKTEFNYIHSEYLDAGTRESIFSDWSNEGQQSGKLRNRLNESRRKLREFRERTEGIISKNDSNNETAVNNDGFSNAENSETHPNTVGAMESDPTSYSYMQNNYGTHMPGENPTRVVDVPLSTDGTDKVSRGAQNIEDGGATPDVMIGYYDEAVRRLIFNLITKG